MQHEAGSLAPKTIGSASPKNITTRILKENRKQRAVRKRGVEKPFKKPETDVPIYVKWPLIDSMKPEIERRKLRTT